MKKLIILSTILFGLYSCAEGPQGPKGPKAPESKILKLDSTSMYQDQNYKVYTLEGCEYIKVGFGRDAWGSHKGNCKNPIHQK
jgi:hypothetical protein